MAPRKRVPEPRPKEQVAAFICSIMHAPPGVAAAAATPSSAPFAALAGAARPSRGGVYAAWPRGEGGEAGSQALLHVELPRGYGGRAGRHKKWPVLVVVPGGGFMSTVRSEGTHTCRHFASRGYVCVWLHYRRYVDAVPMQAMIADVARAVQCVRANAAAWGLDARRVAATGYSAGATLAATLPARDTCREALRAAAPALHDVASAQSFVPDVLLLHYGLYDDPERHAYLLQALYEARAREVNPDAGRWDWRLSEEALAPRRHVRRGAWPPTLLTHGDCDRMVDVEESRAMSRVLEIHGVPHAYVEFAEEDHGYACGTRLPLGDIVPVLGKWVDKFADKFNSIDMFMRTDTRVYLRRTLEYLLNAVFRSGLEADCNWMDRAVAFMAEHAPAVT